MKRRSRSSSEHKTKLKNYLIALVRAQQSNRLPKSSYDFTEFNDVKSYFKAIFDDAREMQHKSVFIKQARDMHPSIRRGYKIVFEFLESDMTSWNMICDELKSAFDIAKHATVNVVESLMAEGHIRNKVLSKLDMEDINRLYGDDNDAKIDRLMLINDGGSVAYQNLLDLITNGEFDKVKNILSTTADIMDKQNKVVGHMKFDPNTRQSNGYNLLIHTIINKMHDTESLDFVEFYLNLGAFDPARPYKWSDGSVKGSMLTPLVYALYRYGVNNDASVYWDVIEMLLKKYPMNEMYLSKSHDFYGYWTFAPKGSAKDIVINNIWIVEHFPIQKIKYLVEHGMDLNVAGDGISRNVLLGISQEIDQVMAEKKTWDGDLKEKQHILQQKEANVKQQQLELANILQKQTPHNAMLRKAEGDLQKSKGTAQYSQKVQETQRLRIAFLDLLNDQKVQMKVIETARLEASTVRDNIRSIEGHISELEKRIIRLEEVQRNLESLLKQESKGGKRKSKAK